MKPRQTDYERTKAQPVSETYHIPGITKMVDRSTIAAMAMQGLLSNVTWMQLKIEYARREHNGDIDKCAYSLKHDIAEDAVEFADALLAELLKKKK